MLTPRVRPTALPAADKPRNFTLTVQIIRSRPGIHPLVNVHLNSQ